MPLGILEETSYEQFSVALGKGDLVLFYTDAITEARAAAGNLLGEAGLLRLVSELHPADPTTLGRNLLAALERVSGGAQPTTT